MSSNVPIVRQFAWKSIVPQLFAIGLIFFYWNRINESSFILYGAITYFIISQLLRRTLSKEHRTGMVKLRQEQFEEAIPHFENSYKYFTENDWADRYRYFLLLNSGKASFKEMALINIAFCYGQIGKGELAKEYYQRTIDEFPNSVLAKVDLRFLNSITDKQ